MMHVGAALMLETIKGLALNYIEEKPQAEYDLSELKNAPKIFTETCKIDWNKSSAEIHNLIRGLSPYPAAFTYLDEKKLKIFNSKIEKTTPKLSPGNYESDGKSFLRFSCTDGYINILELQLEGKKRMNVEDFIRGYRFGNKK